MIHRVSLARAAQAQLERRLQELGTQRLRLEARESALQEFGDSASAFAAPPAATGAAFDAGGDSGGGAPSEGARIPTRAAYGGGSGYGGYNGGDGGGSGSPLPFQTPPRTPARPASGVDDSPAGTAGRNLGAAVASFTTAELPALAAATSAALAADLARTEAELRGVAAEQCVPAAARRSSLRSN